MLSGQDQGQLRVAQYLYNQSSAVDEVANPCFNPGYNKSMQVCEGIALGSSSTCSGPKRDVMFVGTGDYEECRGVIEAAIMHKNYQCLQEPCAVAGRYQPKVGNKTFFAGSAFFYTAQGLGLAVGKGTYVKTYQIVSAGSDFCSTEWSAIGVTKYRNDSKKYSKNYCFASAYIPAMLDAYGIDPDTDTVTYASSVGNEALEWPLGCQLYNNLVGMVGMPPRVVNDHTKAEL